MQLMCSFRTVGSQPQIHEAQQEANLAAAAVDWARRRSLHCLDRARRPRHDGLTAGGLEVKCGLQRTTHAEVLALSATQRAELFQMPTIVSGMIDDWPALRNWTDPRRFAAEATAARPPGAYIPFSAGRKRCIAMGHALQQLQLVVVLLLQHFELRPLRGSEAVALHAREAKPPE